VAEGTDGFGLLKLENRTGSVGLPSREKKS